MFQVTHTLPEETYERWLKFSATFRFVVQRRDRIAFEVAVDALLAQMLSVVDFDGSCLWELLPDLEKEFERSFTEPVAPELYLLATFYRGQELLENPPPSAEVFLSTMHTIVEIIAASYGKDQSTVMKDMLDAFKANDKEFDLFKTLYRAAPSDQEALH